MFFDFIANFFQERPMWSEWDDGLVKCANVSDFTLGWFALWRRWWGGNGFYGFRRDHQRGVERFQKEVVPDQDG